MRYAPPVRLEADTRARTLAGLAGGDAGVFAELRSTHADLIELVVLRVLDERRRGGFALEELDPAIDQASRSLATDRRGSFSAWSGERLDALLGILVRQQAEKHAQDATPHITLLSDMQTPSSVSADYLAADTLATKMLDTLERLATSVGPVVALRLRDLPTSLVARTLGRPIDQVRRDLQRIADRLAEVQTPVSRDAWRDILGATTVEERVALAIRTVDDGPFRRARALAETAWERMGERSIGRLAPVVPGPLQDAHAVAAFVDGSLRGAERMRAFGHLATCARCVEWVARLSDDLDAAEFGARIESHPRWTRLASNALVSHRLSLAESLGAAAEAAQEPHARLLGRLIEVARAIDTEAIDPEVRDVSGVMPSPITLPSDDEAPLVALEALVLDEPRRAFRAVDDHLAKHTIGARLRLLATATGPDLPDSRLRAEEILASNSPDPGLRDDARAVLALPPERALPREALLDRVRDTVQDAVRFLLRPRPA